MAWMGCHRRDPAQAAVEPIREQIMLRPSIMVEVEELAARFGRPLYQVVDVDASSLFDPLGMTDRYGEVCMVIRRPNGRLLTAIKTFYPRGAYRLLTGGIHHGE